MERTYRVGIVGCGRIAGAHVVGYESGPRYEIVAAADINAAAAQALCSKYDVPAWYTDYGQMLETEKLDVVSICTWSGLHAQVTVDVANSGVCGILCEKPMAPSLGAAESMLEICQANDVKLAIGHQHRFDPSWVKARELIASGAIGAPTLAVVRTRDGLTNNGTHYIDGVRYMLGDSNTEWVIAQVERNTDRYERGEPIEDCISGTICFERGVRTLVEVDMPVLQDEEPPPVPTIYGTKGCIELSGDTLRLLNADGWQAMEFPRDVSSHVRQAQEFLRWLDGDVEDYRGSGDKAYETVAAMMAMYESVRIQGVVTMPLKVKESPLEVLIESGRLTVEKPGKYDIRG